MRETLVQRAGSTELSDCRRIAKGGVGGAFLFFILFLVPAGIVEAKPTPSPTISGQQNVQLPLWQSSLSLSSLKNSTLGWSFAGRAAVETASALGNEVSLHHFDLPCQRCHDPVNTTEEKKLAGGSIWEMSVDVNQACSSMGCHEYNPVLNHPVGVSVPGAVGDELLLDKFSRMTCLTCHMDADSPVEGGTSGDDQERMLHVPYGDQACASCHMQIAGAGQRQSHWRFSSRAHLGSINPESRLEKRKMYSIGGVDSESRTCLSCHEEITVTIPGYNDSPGQKRARWAQMSDHPIGMDYSRVAMRKMGKYNYPLTNADQIRLFDGKVGCGSCHSMYSAKENFLVQDNFRSALCFECHNM